MMISVNYIHMDIQRQNEIKTRNPKPETTIPKPQTLNN